MIMHVPFGDQVTDSLEYDILALEWLLKDILAHQDPRAVLVLMRNTQIDTLISLLQSRMHKGH